jgi:glutaredoxin
MTVVYVVMAVVIIFGLYLFIRAVRNLTPDTVVGTTAPAFAYTSLDGQTDDIFHPGEYSIVTLIVLQSGCPFCEKAVPLWNHLQDSLEYKSVYGLSISPAEETAAFMSEQKTMFPMLLVGGEFLTAYHCEGTPTTITLQNGIIQNVIDGVPLNDDIAQLINFHRKGYK